MRRALSLPSKLLLLALPTAAVLHAAGCGARSELWAPEGGGGGGDPGCTKTQTAAYSASIGGGIHHLYTECLPRADGAACPSADEAATLLVLENCSLLDSVECGPIVEAAQCCYVVLETCALT